MHLLVILYDGISFVFPVHPLTAFVYIEKESMEIRGKESISLK